MQNKPRTNFLEGLDDTNLVVHGHDRDHSSLGPYRVGQVLRSKARRRHHGQQTASYATNVPLQVSKKKSIRPLLRNHMYVSKPQAHPLKSPGRPFSQ
jgi:hypothetical protein